jgi:toxin-antitoxin system PIN domain toxin
VIHLLDVNALLALGHAVHPDHAKVESWVKSQASRLATCSITEIGFLRVSLQAKLCTDIADARNTLSAVLASPRFTFLAYDVPAASLPPYVRKAAEVTDGHLLDLARRHGAKLATLDTGIPGAELIK